METRRLVTISPHKYGTRHLVAGEEYDAPVRDALALVAGRKARFADRFHRNPAVKPAPAPVASPEPESPPQPVATMTTDAARLETLRMEAWRLGVAVDGRWGIARLQQEIAQARQG
jgi:hypothetical protein